MLLKELFQKCRTDGEPILSACEISGIYTDSRAVVSGGIFVALRGQADDGMRFIPQALERGAAAIVSHEPVPADQRRAGIVYLSPPDIRSFLRKAVGEFYGPLSSRVRLTGITGTNGKTTTAYLTAHLLNAAGHPSGIIGTIACHVGDKTYPSVNTTPGFVETHQWLALMAREKMDDCVMEVSSHALDQGRTDLMDFACAVFTNLTDEHLDYHKDKESYFQAKAKLFTCLSSRARAVINADDAYGRRLLAMSRGRILTYAMDHPADLKARHCRIGIGGTTFEADYQGETFAFESLLIGRHNIENLLAGIGAALSQGIDMEKIRQAVKTFQPVKGRLERVETQRDFSVVIDYAHTPDALEKILQTLRTLTEGRILLVFGCGGDRDRTKRPKMGRIAGELADYAFVTSDNPRTEDPQKIMDEIIPGFETRNFQVIADRREAIAQALKAAGSGDVVLIAGKGHEDYQILKDGKIPFDERVIVRECLKNI